MAQEAWELEINILNEPIGKQDQYAAAYGGFNVIHFDSSENVSVECLKLKSSVFNLLQENLLMFYTGITRNASEILSDQKKHMTSEKHTSDKMVQMVHLVKEAKNCLLNSDVSGFGRLLDESWQLKKQMSDRISTSSIDEIYSLALKNGALGGKLLGAGGGGFLIFYCEKNYQPDLRKALNKLREVKFRFEETGSKLIQLKH